MTTPNPDLEAAAAEIRAVITEYDATQEAALQKRDAGVRAVAEKYALRPKQIETLTGYSRETVRQIRNPEIRDAMRRAAEARKRGAAE